MSPRGKRSGSRPPRRSRLTLSQILLAGLDDVVQFGKEFVRYEHLSNGQVTTVFSDGTTAAGDLLIGVDGANSRVSRQYLPKAERVDTGAVGISGKLELNESSRAWLPNRVTKGMNVILGPQHFLFTAIFNRRRKPEEAPKLLDDEVRGAGLDPELLFRSLENKDYILWAFVTRRDDRTIKATNEQGESLQKLVSRMIEGWHPDLRRMIAETSSDMIQAFEFRTSVAVKPWESTNVTLLGDAIHSMTPAGGVGANAALRNASLLCRMLIDVKKGKQSLIPAVHSYEAQMLEYGFAAVKDSMSNTKQALADRIPRIMGKGFLRLCGALPSLRRAVFRDRWSDNNPQQQAGH